ncbi:hypothetical protein [Streptomyces sp. NBC_00576]|uniref:hypothetical protein n=1 Tax=Streptomyces sp. NBC_00576 TaxID=2903665 RepID=UPI002E7FE427|nr:hypothetical protein [Streptomyces sp. NBC_00576]WUB68863.1 hypothetical protein OG734_01475 [Streptomyces sp. NBC_00576]
MVQVEPLAGLDRRVEAGATRLNGWRIRGLSLRKRGGDLAGLRVVGATFLGYTFAEATDSSASTDAEQVVRDGEHRVCEGVR